MGLDASKRAARRWKRSNPADLSDANELGASAGHCSAQREGKIESRKVAVPKAYAACNFMAIVIVARVYRVASFGPGIGAPTARRDAAIVLREGQMSTKFTLWPASMVATLCLALASAAQATPLSFVNVNTPAYLCAFNQSCVWALTAADSLATFVPPQDVGPGILQSRTPLQGVAPALAAGDWGYQYRVNLTGVAGANCVNALELKFWPVAAVAYLPPNLADVFVVTQGGVGSVGLNAVSQGNGANGNFILFTFAGNGVCPGASSFFFGLATKKPPPSGPSPAPGVVRLYFSGSGVPVVPQGQVQVP